MFITISNNLLELNSENHDGTMNKGKVAINNISNNVYQLFNTSHDISNIESDYNKLSLNKDVLISNIIEKVELGTNNEEILREEMGDTSVNTGNINNYVGKLLFTDKLNTKIYLYTNKFRYSNKLEFEEYTNNNIYDDLEITLDETNVNNIKLNIKTTVKDLRIVIYIHYLLISTKAIIIYQHKLI